MRNFYTHPVMSLKLVRRNLHSYSESFFARPDIFPTSYLSSIRGKAVDAYVASPSSQIMDSIRK